MRYLRRIAITTPVLLLSAAGVYYGGGFASSPRSDRVEGASGSQFACRFEVGQEAAFRLSSIVEAVGDAATAPPADRLTATLSWRVDEEEVDAWRLQARLHDLNFTQNLSLPHERVQQSLDTPFAVRIDRRCRFVSFGFSPQWRPRTRQLVASLLKTYEFVMPDQRGQEVWTVDQTDGLGTFEARYARPASDEAVVRTKLAYRRHPMADMLKVARQVRHARATGRMASAGDWLTAIEGREHVHIQVGGTDPVELRQTFKLTREDERFRPASVVENFDWQDPYDMKVEDTPVAESGFEHTDYRDIVERFAHLRSQGPSHSFAASRLLAGYLRAHPAHAHRLVADIRAGVIAPSLRPAAFLALEMAGTPESTAALTDALEDPSFTELDRSRAALALSEAGSPTMATAEVLQRAAYDEDSEMVANVGLLALGSLGARTQSADPEVSAAVRASLREALESAPTEGRRLVALDAMGNAADPAFLEPLMDELLDGRSSVRAHAAEALRRAAPGSVGPRLQERLRVETDPAVQVAMIGTLRHFGPPDDSAIAWASDLLAGADSPRVRAALIGWLGSASHATPAREALATHFRVERDVDLLRLIGKFLPASAL